MKKTLVTAYFRVDIDLLKEVEEVRQKLGQTRAQFMVDAITKHLEGLKREGLAEKVYRIRSEE